MSAWRTSGEGCAGGLLGEMLATASVLCPEFAGIRGASLSIDGPLEQGIAAKGNAEDLSLIFSLDDVWSISSTSV